MLCETPGFTELRACDAPMARVVVSGIVCREKRTSYVRMLEGGHFPPKCQYGPILSSRFQQEPLCSPAFLICCCPKKLAQTSWLKATQSRDRSGSPRSEIRVTAGARPSRAVAESPVPGLVRVGQATCAPRLKSFGWWEKLDGKDVAQRPYQDRTGKRRVDNFAKLGAQTQPQWEEEFAGQERGGRSLVFRFRVGIAAEV